MHTLTYSNDVSHIVGDSFGSEYLQREGKASIRHWVVTDAVYNPETNTTRVELDEIA